MANERESWTAPDVLVPGVPMLGWLSFSEATDAGLAAHDHGPAYEACLITRGGVDWWVEREVHEVTAGHLYLTRPNERHGSIDATLQPCELMWMSFRFDSRPRLAGLSAAECDALAQRFAELPSRLFPADAQVTSAFTRARDAHRRRDDLAPLEARASVIDVLLGILRCGQGSTREATAPSREIAAAMAWMSEHLAEDFSIEQAAAVAGLSVTQFHERFRAEVGFAPGDWRTRQRVRRAKQMLRTTDRAVTDIALRCGFATSQYFATAFRKQVGLSPSDYRNNR